MLTFKDLRLAQHDIIDRQYEGDAVQVVLGMGGGKTAATLTTIFELRRDGIRRKAIVLAPPMVATSVWPRECAKWVHLQDTKVVDVSGTPQQRLKLLMGEGDVFAVSIYNAKWLADVLATLPDNHPLLDILVIDELSKLKGPRSKLGRALVEQSHRIKTIWGLTGTPRPNGFEDQFMPMRILTRDKLWGHDFDTWRRRNFMPMDFNGYAWEVHDFRATQLVKDINTVTVHIPDEDMPETEGLNAGPEHNYIVELPQEARKVYKQMEDHLIAEVLKTLGPDAGEQDFVVALSQAVASSKLEQLAQGYLYDDGATITHLHDVKLRMFDDMLSATDNENVVVAYKYKEDLALLEKKYGKDLVVLGGGGPKRALKVMDKWNEGRIKILALHPASGGHGIELQHGGRRIFWYCPTWSSEMYDQTNKRLDRPSQKRPVFSHQIVAADTVDIVKVNRVQFKMDDQDAFKHMLRRA